MAAKAPEARSLACISSWPINSRGVPRRVCVTRVFVSRPLGRLSSIPCTLPNSTSRSGQPLAKPKRLYWANCCAVSTVTPAGYGAHIAGGAKHKLSRSRHATWMSRSVGSGATSLNFASGGVCVPSSPDAMPAPVPCGVCGGPLTPLPRSDPARAPGHLEPACH